jgi:cobalamin biosynthesis protein CobW
VTVDGVVTVVDGKAVTEGRFAHSVAAVDAQRKLDENLDHETPLSELFEDQIACADMIVVNKTDLLEVAEAEALVDTLRESSRDGVQVVTTAMGKLPVDVLLGQGIGAEGDLEARHELHHHHHDHDEDYGDDHDPDHDHDHDHDAFESFVVTLGEIADTKAFSDQVSTIIGEHDILRLKGFAAVSGKPMRLTLQAVGPRVETYFDQPFGDIERATRLVVIGQAGLDHAAIEAALKSCAAAQ